MVTSPPCVGTGVSDHKVWRPEVGLVHASQHLSPALKICCGQSSGFGPARRPHPWAQTGAPTPRCSSEDPGGLLQGVDSPGEEVKEQLPWLHPAEAGVTPPPNPLTLVPSAPCCTHMVPAHLDSELCWAGQVTPREAFPAQDAERTTARPASPGGWAMSGGRTHRGLAEPMEVHAQVRSDAVHGPRESDASQEQRKEDHVRHGGRDPHDLGRAHAVQPHQPLWAGLGSGPLMACAQTEGLGLVSPVSRTVPGCQLGKCPLEQARPGPSFLSLPGIETRQPGREGAFCLHLGHGCRHEWRDFRCVKFE